MKILSNGIQNSFMLLITVLQNLTVDKVVHAYMSCILVSNVTGLHIILINTDRFLM